MRSSFICIVLLAACVVPASNTAPSTPMTQQPGAAAPPAMAPPPPMRGDGTWATTWYWNAGTCGLSGTIDHSMFVTHAAHGYTIVDADPYARIDGDIHCTSEECKMLVSQTGRLNGAPATVSVNFVLRPNGSINGSGSVSLTSPSCSQSFTATGWRS